MSRIASFVGLLAALAGFAAAHALALEVPPLPGVTVTVPSLPVTTALPPPPPPPTVPPVTTAPPPVTLPPPPVTVTTPPATPPRDAPPPAPKPVAPPIVTSPTPRASAPPSSSPGPANRAQRLRATPRRSKARVTVRLEFQLPEAKRLFVIVRGPAPSCDVAGVIPVRGRSGANKIVFAGRAGGRALPPGTYALSLSPVRRPASGAPATFVEVVSKRRSVPARANALRPDCTDSQALAYSAAGLLRREDTGAGRGARPGSRGDTLTSVPPGGSDDQHDVLGAAIPGSGPDSGGVSESLFESLLSIGVLTLIGAMLLATGALVTRFVRGSWNP